MNNERQARCARQPSETRRQANAESQRIRRLTISSKLVSDKEFTSIGHLFTKPSSFDGFQLVKKVSGKAFYKKTNVVKTFILRLETLCQQCRTKFIATSPFHCQNISNLFTVHDNIEPTFTKGKQMCFNNILLLRIALQVIVPFSLIYKMFNI